MKTLFLLSSLLFAGQSFGQNILCDRGDEWFQTLQSPSEVIACDWVGYGVCYEGNASAALKNYFRVGQILDVENVGTARIDSAVAKRGKIAVVFNLKNDGKNILNISRCK